jgi:hypothetical protein
LTNSEPVRCAGSLAGSRISAIVVVPAEGCA